MLEILNYNVEPVLQVRNATYPFAVVNVASIVNLRNYEPTYTGQVIYLLGNAVAGVGGGEFRHDASSTLIDDSYNTIVTVGGKRWLRIASISQNIYGDPFSETVTSSKEDDIFAITAPSFTSIETASPNTPFAGKRTLKATTTSLLRKYIRYSLLGIRNGEDFRVRVIASYAGTGSIQISLRNLAGTTLQTFTRSSITAGLVDYTTPAFQGDADGYEIAIFINESNDLDRELIAIAVGKGQGSPEITNAPLGVDTIKSLSNLRNLCPDPFFRRYVAGETHIDGYDLGTQAWSVVDLATNPFKNKKAQYFASGTPFSERYIDVKNIGLRLGQRYTIKLGIIAPVGGSLGLGAWFRRLSDDTAITSIGTANYTLLDNTYIEISRSITITQELIDTPIYLVVRHNGSNTVFASGYYICAWAIYENDTGQEIVDEDFAIDAVNLRVKSLETASASLNEIYTFNQFRLRETKQRLQKLKLAETAQLSIAIHGSSTTQLGTRYITPLTTELVSEYGDAGGGWLGFGFITSSNGNVRSSIYAYSRTGTWTSDYYSALSADMSTVESSVAGSRLTIAGLAGTPILSGIDLHWVATANGVIRYSWNGGSSWTTLNVQGTVNTVNITSLTGFPTTGNFSLIIEVVSGSVILSGLNIKSTANGVVVHKLGNSGGRLQHVAEINNTEWIKTIINLAPNVFFIFHGGNDQDVGRTPTQFADNLRTVIDRIKIAMPACDIGIIMPPAVVEPRTTPLALYTAEAFKVAQEKKVAFIDLQKVFGETPSEYSSTSPRPWFNIDDIHPEPSTGGRAIVSALYKFIKY
jgi:lysophospholipase L1-like esterase